MKRNFALLLALTLSLSCASSRPDAQKDAGPNRITIFHTNDVHASFTSSVATWEDDEPQIGGFAALEYHLANERKTAPHSLYLDAGDFMTGNPISNISRNGVLGGALIELFERAGLDAMALGNHEFDHPQPNPRKIIETASFPILSANVLREDGTYFTDKPYVIREVGGARIGIIGLSPDDLAELVGGSALAGLTTKTSLDVLPAIIAEIDPVTDVIVLLTHEGVEVDRKVAAAVPGIDIIVGGHSHTRLENGEWVNGVFIVQAGSKLRYVGRMDFLVENDAVTDVEYRLIPLWADNITPPEATVAMIAEIEKQIDDEYGVVVGQSAGELGRNYHRESDLGNWMSERVRRATGADVAFLNSGGLRKNMPAGEIKKLDIVEILPFSNMLCTFPITGAKLIEVIEQNIETGLSEEHGILQMSGIQVEWGQTEDKVYVAEAMLGNDRDGYSTPVDPDAVYTVGTVDYVGKSQPLKYLGYQPENVQGLGRVLADSILETLADDPAITAPKARRAIRHHQSSPTHSIQNAG